MVTDGMRVYQSLYDIYEEKRFVYISYISNFNFKGHIDERVIAWQPLPETYKGE